MSHLWLVVSVHVLCGFLIFFSHIFSPSAGAVAAPGGTENDTSENRVPHQWRAGLCFSDFYFFL